jgi:RNA polymerase sigma-70 factor (ECF subfamily)
MKPWSFSEQINNASLDDQLFITLYEEYFTPLYRYVFYRTRDTEQSMDIVQTTFLKMYRVEKNLNPEHIIPYLYRIARNQIIDYYRKKKPVRLYNFMEYVESIPDTSLPHPENMTSDAESIKYLYQLLATLNPQERDIIIMRSIQEQSYREISLALDRSEPTIRKIHSRALQKLQAIYEQTYE